MTVLFVAAVDCEEDDRIMSCLEAIKKVNSGQGENTDNFNVRSMVAQVPGTAPCRQIEKLGICCVDLSGWLGSVA